MASCSNDEEAPAAAASRIVIEPLITRATEVNFEAGDRIGLTVVKAGATYADNALLTYADGVFAGSLLWYAESGETASLAAYYPYDAAGAPTTFSVAADQTTAYGSSDLMASYKEEVLPSDQAVSMVFKHLLTKIIVNTVNETGSEIASVTLEGIIPTAAVDIAALTAEADASAAAGSIKTQTVVAGEQYRAIVVPQTVQMSLSATLANGKTLTQKLASATLKQGGQYTVTARVLPDNLQVVLSAEIENWSDEGEIPGDTGEVSFEDHPDEEYFVYDGLQYKTVTLANGSRWMAEPMAYVPEGYTPSDNPETDSHIWYPYELTEIGTTITAGGAEALTDAESVKSIGYLYDMYAALGVDEITEQNAASFEGARGICPEGWHIPTRMEYFALCGYSNKGAGEDAFMVDDTALFYAATGSGGGEIGLFNEGGWNYVMCGTATKNTWTGTRQYQKTTLYSGNTSDATPAEYFGKPALSYYLTSTYYGVNASKTYLQFFCLMSTFTTTYPKGRLSLAYAHIETGSQLRCIKDKE